VIVRMVKKINRMYDEYLYLAAASSIK
jgi:hypothetical protein